jgi:4-amino-4-deoxychorismate lyase
MFLVYNNTLAEETTFALPPDNRGLHYGDGLFETIRYQNGHIWFWPSHADRLQRGLNALHLNAPAGFAEIAVETISNLLIVNELTNQTSRIKLQIWRKPGGLYTPTNTGIDWLLTARPGSDFIIGEKACIGISESVRLTHSPISGVKTGSALPYVLAGLERQQRGLDELILLQAGSENILSECTAANLFWLKDSRLYTPSLEAGCLSGIMRRQILRVACELQIPVQEGLFSTDALTGAEAVFSTNVNGIHYLRQIDGIGNFPAEHPVVKFLTDKLLSVDA